MAYTTINKHTDYFNTKLYTGNGGTNAITGVGHQPDFTWMKRRDQAAWHYLTDAVRGVTKTIYSNSNSAEGTKSNGLTAFGTDGFTLGNEGDVNENNGTYAAWNWKANGAGSANTDGTINSTVSASTTAGFSVVKWTTNGSAHTVGHGLGTTPQVIIAKPLHEVNNWMVYHDKLADAKDKYMVLDGSNAVQDYHIWNDTAPTSSVFSWGAWSGNDNGGNVIAYCFAEKTGYSKFGSFLGNSSTDGTFVYTGFKPSFVIYKRYDSGSYNWVLVDNKRGAGDDELIKKYFHPDTNAAEGSTTLMDFLSNGFKMRINDTTSNQGSIMYMAFGQSLVGSNNVPCTAR